jgi:hypothetical protein
MAGRRLHNSVCLHRIFVLRICAGFLAKPPSSRSAPTSLIHAEVVLMQPELLARWLLLHLRLFRAVRTKSIRTPRYTKWLATILPRHPNQVGGIWTLCYHWSCIGVT